MSYTSSCKTKLAEYETQERFLASKLFSSNKGISEYSFTSGRIFYDGIAVSTDGRKAIFEIKVRSFGIHSFNNYFLEIAKFKNLYEAGERTGNTILYINFFKTEDPDRWDYLVFNITKRVEEWKVKGSPAIERVRMNAKTFVSKTDKIYKDIIRLEYEEDKDKTGSVFCSIN